MIHPNQKHAIENALKYLAVVREELVKWPKVDTNKALTYTSLAIESSNVSLWHAGEIDFGLGCKLAEAIGGLHALRTHLESGPMWGSSTARFYDQLVKNLDDRVRQLESCLEK